MDLITFIEEIKDDGRTKQNSRSKTRGKYVTACPDVPLIHNKPLRRKKERHFARRNVLVDSLDQKQIGTAKKYLPL